jgi:release factor glutamine methyltransferase
MEKGDVMLALWRPALERIWRVGLRWRFVLLQRHRYNRLSLERAAGRPILVLPQVFNPSLFFTSEYLVGLFSRQLIPAGAAVLDMGTGSGLGAICAAPWAERVVAVDINPAAVRCARINAMLNEVEGKVEVRQGDLFAPVAGERFDVVLFNPPFYRGAPRDNLDRAWRSDDVVERFATGLGAHLAPGGCALVVLSSNSDLPAFLRAFAGAGFAVETVAERDMISETLLVYRLRPR